MKTRSKTPSRGRSRATRQPSLLVEMPNDAGMDNRPGEIYIANDSRFVESNFSEPLTTYATGYRDPNNIEADLEFIAPSVQTPRRFEFAAATNAEEFLTETDDVRAIGSDFKRVEFTSSKVDSKTLNKGLTIRVDLDNVEGMPNWRQMYTGRLVRRLHRNELRRAVGLLSAAATNVNKTWNTDAGKDPDQDVLDTIITATTASGIPLNRAAYGFQAWNRRLLSHRAQQTAGGFASSSLTEAQVAAYLGLPGGVQVLRERYQSTASLKAGVLESLVLLYMAEAAQTPEDPSNIKRFWSPCEGGQRMRVYEQRINSKMIDITVEHYSNIIVTSTLGIYKVTVS